MVETLQDAKPNPKQAVLQRRGVAAEHSDLVRRTLAIHEVLKYPKRALIVSLPEKMDNGSVRV